MVLCIDGMLYTSSPRAPERGVRRRHRRRRGCRGEAVRHVCQSENVWPRMGRESTLSRKGEKWGEGGESRAKGRFS